MDRFIALTWSWLNVLSTKRVDALRGAFGDLETAFQHIDEELLKKLGCQQETIYATLNRLEEFDPASYEKELERRGLRFCSIEDEEYPDALRQIADPPTFLYWKGDLSALSSLSIGLVGRREMSPYGKRVVEHFVPAFVQAGLTTVSGLALGIDAVVAEETLRVDGKTVGVLGHGLATIYPKSNNELAKRIIESGGLIMSEFPLDTTPGKHTFPARNRIIAGLTLGTVVLEAGEGSGALITADLALDYGREVFAVPGQIFDPGYEGCHDAIANGTAKLVTDPSQVLQDIGIVAPQSGAPAPQEREFDTEEEEKLFESLTTMPQHTGDLVEKSGLIAASVNATLTLLELKGAAKNVGEGKWVRC